MNGARVFVRMLQEYGVDVMFGVPGDTSIPLYEALYDARDSVRHVMARDEQSASFMADAYARLAYKPGVCECPSGAGPLYSVPGVAEANASSIPVLLITSDISLAGEGRKTITELDCEGLFKSVTKWSSQVKTVHKIPEIVRRAFRIATTGRPGARLVGLFGDGSLGMSAGELETLARLNIPAVLIHFNNAGFGWIKALQALHSKGKFYSVEFRAGEPALVARGFGLKALHIETPKELVAGMEEAFSASGPIFLDITAESLVTDLPPVYSRLKAAEKHNKPIVHT